MTHLSKHQCHILDQILASFDSNGCLARELVMSIFNNDEKLASSYIEILVGNELVVKIGETEESDLPLALMKEPKAEMFIQNGGFLRQYEEVERDNILKKLSEENLILQNDNFKYSKTIREQEQRIRDMDEQNKFFETLKNYWWLFVGLYALGAATSKFLL